MKGIPPLIVAVYYTAWRKSQEFSDHIQFSNDEYFREIYEGRRISRENPYILMLKILEMKRSVEPKDAEEILKTEEYKMLEEKTAGMTPNEKMKYFGRLIIGLDLLRECGKVSFQY